MVSKILPVAALAGAAMAACPLSVEISGTTNHVAQVAITNTGAEAITVFKGNTVLSEHATLDLVASTGMPIRILNSKEPLSITSVPVLMLQCSKLSKAGETVTASVNAAKTYNLEGLEKVNITAIQGFRYVTGEVAPTLLSQTTFLRRCHFQHGDHYSRPKQSFITSSLKTTVADAITLATNAYTAAGTGAYYFTTWFKSTSEESAVRTIYNDVKNVQTTGPKISFPSENVIVPCPDNGYWGFDEYSATCANFDYDRAGSLLHEMTHLYGTEDWAYGPTAAKALTAAKAANNADTYEMYAGSV
ncbi:hypothetical protein DID88_006061 [Monilinia fructigena]|uniref:Lysine-specific metallo-endopeptidase domain-containing protein n=1 Tax=Monilinia fructigena TaxID=38457 RepID=A0A395IDY9_9HELO|nr:hypothetical protein DID88_006061 [Monilinia fructigena]